MTDQELIQLLDQRSVEQWPARELALLRQRVRHSAQVRQAFLARVYLEEALQGALARPPYTAAALSAGVMALLAQKASSAALKAAFWWWGTLGGTALVLTVVVVGTWSLRNKPTLPEPAPPVVQRPVLPLVAPEPSDPKDAVPLAQVEWSPSDKVPQGFSPHWDPEAEEDPPPSQWSLPMGSSLPLVAPGPEGSGP